MRTIKFRGRRCDNGVWVYGYYARLSNEFKEWHCIMTEKDASENYIKDCNGYNMLYTPVDHNTVGQFTGLYDKNGKEIYEGDIVKRTDGYSYIVKYEFGSFYTRLIGGDKEDVYRLALFNNKTVIVGNIHDNPDLMKGEQQ